MNRDRPRRRWLRTVLLVLLAVAVAIHVEVRWGLFSGFRLRPRVIDDAGLLGRWDQAMAEKTLDRIQTESGVDIRFIFLSKLEGESIEEFAVRRARELGVGQTTGRRGLLFVYDVGGRDLRVEVGPTLQDRFTDAFIGRLIRTHAGSFFGAGNPKEGMVSTLMVVQHRLREAALDRSYDPAFAEYIEDVRRLAIGGGASTVAPTRSDSTAFLNSAAGAGALAYFRPQPTVEASYWRYLEWMALGRYLPELPLFTPPSRDYLSEMTMTRGFMEFLLLLEYGHRYAIEERDALALLHFTDDPFAQPHFFRRTEEGWQMDIMAELQNTRNYVGGLYSWGMLPSGDEFARAFADRYIPIGGIWRLAGGDNRAIPIHDASVARELAAVYGAAAAAEASSVSRITVRDAAERIAAVSGRPSIVVLYSSTGPREEAVFDELAAAAGQWQAEGVELLAFAIDRDETVPALPAFLQQHGATFAPVNLYRWPAGTLDRAMAPLGIQIGKVYDHPLIAVRAADGKVVYQQQGFTSVAAANDALERLRR
jgi:uncharacterized protein